MSDVKHRSGALRLKGDTDLLAKKAKKKAKKEKKKAKKRKLEEKPDLVVLDEEVHSGWYKVQKYLYYIAYTPAFLASFFASFFVFFSGFLLFAYFPK